MLFVAVLTPVRPVNSKPRRFFYRMPETGSSQWIYTHPEERAPRTGEGIFPMEVVEVTQVCMYFIDIHYILRSTGIYYVIYWIQLNSIFVYSEHILDID